jgi:hypothetical protein
MFEKNVFSFSLVLVTREGQIHRADPISSVTARVKALDARIQGRCHVLSYLILACIRPVQFYNKLIATALARYT